MKTNSKVQDYKLVWDSYTGLGGFKNGSYLIQYEAEDEDGIKRRKLCAKYNNYIASFVDGKVDPVFSKIATRTYKDNEIIKMFIEDADNNQTSLQEYIHKATTMTTLLGNSFLIVDNFPEKELMKNLKDTLTHRKFPYIYSKETYDVSGFQKDKFGALESITFNYYPIDSDGDESDYDYFQEFNKDYNLIYRIEKKLKVEKVKEEIFKNNHMLGRVPVVYFNKSILPNSPYYSMAGSAKALYNLDSEIQNLCSTQSFSLLLMPSTSPGEDGKDQVVGANNALFFDADATNVPSYISPDAAILTGLREIKSSSIEELIQSADVLGTSAISSGTGASSGIAESYKFFGKMFALLQSKKIAESIESDLIKVVSIMIGEAVEYEVEYESNYSPTFFDIKQKIDVLGLIADRDISPLATSKANSSIMELAGGFMDWTDEEMEAIKDSITEYSVVDDG